MFGSGLKWNDWQPSAPQMLKPLVRNGCLLKELSHQLDEAKSFYDYFVRQPSKGLTESGEKLARGRRRLSDFPELLEGGLLASA